MVAEESYHLTERIINFIEIIGCGIVADESGEKVVEMGDFLDNDRQLVDLWGSMSTVIARKLDKPLVNAVAHSELFKMIVFPLDGQHLGAKIARSESAWKVSAKMEPIIRAMETTS